MPKTEKPKRRKAFLTTLTPITPLTPKFIAFCKLSKMQKKMQVCRIYKKSVSIQKIGVRCKVHRKSQEPQGKTALHLLPGIRCKSREVFHRKEMHKLTTSERFKKFDADFAKLKGNREKVPLGQLATRYAKAYNALVADIEEYAEWFIWEYINTLAIQKHPKDEAGNAWLERKVKAILDEEQKPGRLSPMSVAALIIDLDKEKFEDRVWRIHDRLMREAYDPYQQRFNKWVGQPDNRWIYNSLFDAFWKEDPEVTEGGYWIDKEWNHKGFGYPPRLASEQTKEEHT